MSELQEILQACKEAGFDVAFVAEPQEWDIWAEGCWGDHADWIKASKINEKVGPIKAYTFEDACNIYFNQYANAHSKSCYYKKDGELMFWGCKLFDNEEDAKRRQPKKDYVS